MTITKYIIVLSYRRKQLRAGMNCIVVILPYSERDRDTEEERKKLEQRDKTRRVQMHNTTYASKSLAATGFRPL